MNSRSCITIGKHSIHVSFKRIKHLRLSFNRRTHSISLSAPIGIDHATILAFLQSRQSWLDKQSSSVPPCITQVSYLDAEQIMLAGKSYTLRVLENQRCNRIVIEHEQIVLLMVTDMSLRQRTALFDTWYRINLALRIEPLIKYWQRIMAVELSTWSIMKMKSRWGSCNTKKRSIRFNLELAKLSDYLLEYVVVHELAHLIEPSHNHIFKSVVESFLPDWKTRKATLRTHIINY